ncbi:GNAT family N-acetyltransferase [Deinococcus aerophilus]|uniref:N-acetyltransferase n=1 Tax=Deinococcus aerophilus TaxID=522488 RepID=A0ABQ2GIR7_9DEIO|nr:GNAT family N-acetyltransferase [Deinococcus aerophilus]GGL98467.1 N-acetyltransferase [Deinococcus aerophilus]
MAGGGPPAPRSGEGSGPGRPLIRPAQPSDEARLGEIAYLTGFFGDSARAYFPDQQLFADLWVRPYLHLDHNVSFVAQVGSEVVGYILGSVDEAEYRHALLRDLARTVLPGALSQRYRRPLSGLPYLTRTLLYPSPHAPEREFPAHLHLNLLPNARGLGLGRNLLRTFLHQLADRGVAGVQLSTTDRNQAALGLYTNEGFGVSASRPTPLWTPWLTQPVQQLCLTRPMVR